MVSGRKQLIYRKFHCRQVIQEQIIDSIAEIASRHIFIILRHKGSNNYAQRPFSSVKIL